MATKFRNSFFGFNKEDVHQFVFTAKEKEHKYENTINDLEKQVSSLNSDIENLGNKVTSLLSELNEANEKICDYVQREEAIARLSESIGRLYLVAQSNAQAIAAAAKENIEISENVVNHNIEISDNAQSDFAEIEQELNDRVAQFNKDIAELRNRLNLTKDKIIENNSVISESENALDNMTAELNVK